MSFPWARVRRLFDSTVLFWSVALVLAVATGLAVTGSPPDPSGGVPVVVAQRDIPAGSPIAGSVSPVAWRGPIPDDALSSIPDPEATASSDIAAGEPVLARRIGSMEGVAARLDPATLGIHLPAAPTSFAEVTHVDLIGTGDPVLGSGTSEVLAERAPIVSFEADGLIVGLTVEQSLTVVDALVNGALTVAISGPAQEFSG